MNTLPVLCGGFGFLCSFVQKVTPSLLQDFLLSKVSDCQGQLTPIAQVVGVSFYIWGHETH